MKNWMSILLTLSLTVFIAGCGDDSKDEGQNNNFTNNFTNPTRNNSGLSNFTDLRKAVQDGNFAEQKNTREKYMQVNGFNNLPEPCDNFICFDFDFNFTSFDYNDPNDFDVIVDSTKTSNSVTVINRRDGSGASVQVNKNDIKNNILNVILDESKIRKDTFYGMYIFAYPIVSAPLNLYGGYMFVVEHTDGSVHMFSLDLPLAANYKLNQVPHSLIVQ